jgi:hypothetical protein
MGMLRRAVGLLPVIVIAGCGTYSAPPPAPLYATYFPPAPPPPAQSVFHAVPEQGPYATWSTQDTAVVAQPLPNIPGTATVNAPNGGTYPSVYSSSAPAQASPPYVYRPIQPTAQAAQPAYRPSYQPPSLPKYKPTCAENGSCYGDISTLTGRPKTVHVGGYYRKDGTYVRGHYRSRPRR